MLPDHGVEADHLLGWGGDTPYTRSTPLMFHSSSIQRLASLRGPLLLASTP